MDLYGLLGLARDASAGEIKRAYKRLARRFHPDINPGDRMAAPQFRQIAEAYETLSDPERRRRYGAVVVKSARGHIVFSKACAHCGGSGRQRQAICPTCGGQQVEMRSEPLTIAVPPGLPAGARIRIPGKGHVGRNGGENGDLYITVHVLPHPLFRREGDDLHIVVPVAIHEAALGTKFEVPSLDGPARVRVPPGTQSG